jgi:hypothetical protein
MKGHPETNARWAAGLLTALAACACMAVSACGAATSNSGTAPNTPGAAHHTVTSGSAPAAAGATTGSAHLTGNLCADAAVANSEIRAITLALVTEPAGRRQHVAKLVRTAVATYAGLGSEAPGPLKYAFAKLAGFYRSVESRLASGDGQVTLADLEPLAHSGLAPAVHQVSTYFVTHCAA